MKKKKTFIGLTVGIVCTIIVIILCIWFYNNFISVNGSLKRDEKYITKLINKKYPEYSIDSLELQYVDFFSSVRAANDNYFPHRATEAEVFISNRDEKIKLNFYKKLLVFWAYVALPIEGPKVDDNYYLYSSGAYNCKIADIEQSKYENMDYSGLCILLYKTENGIGYEYDLQTSSWEKTYKDYNYLTSTIGYSVITEEKAKSIINYFESIKDVK